MMILIKKILKMWIPERLRMRMIHAIAQEKQGRFLKELKSDVLAYFQSKPILTDEEQEVVDYLNSNDIAVFPYDFRSRYDKSKIEVHRDESNSLPYVYHDQKKLYFKRSYSDSKIKSLYHGLLLDQDHDSPHRYLTDDFRIGSNDVIADIGAAEGNFSLSNVEKVKKVYLFECDAEWIEALEATFSPWKEKVIICNQFVSDTDSNDSISLDHFAKEHDDITFLKVDIEGEESRFLNGAHNFLCSSKPFKMAICTYHKQEDEAEFTALLESCGLAVAPSRRFMIFYHDQSIKAPYLRRGLLRAEKKEVIHE